LKKEVEKLSNSQSSKVFFFDEGRFGLQSTVTRIWTEKGKTPEIRVKQGHENFYFYSAISPNSGEPFSLFLPEVNTGMMNLYLEEFSKEQSNSSILIIMDQAGWHKSHGLRIPGNIKLKFLPSYSPELNPVERLWKWMRKEVTHNNLFNTVKDLMDKLSTEYRSLTNTDFSRLCHCDYL
jgi:transposase